FEVRLVGRLARNRHLASNRRVRALLDRQLEPARTAGAFPRPRPDTDELFARGRSLSAVLGRRGDDESENDKDTDQHTELISPSSLTFSIQHSTFSIYQSLLCHGCSTVGAFAYRFICSSRRLPQPASSCTVRRGPLMESVLAPLLTLTSWCSP